jgi:hypothetical protein
MTRNLIVVPVVGGTNNSVGFAVGRVTGYLLG